MIFSKPKYDLKPADWGDEAPLNRLLSEHQCRQHRHLDWRVPTDWLGYKPFWLLTKEERVSAALAFPPDPPGVYWVRLFATTHYLKMDLTWEMLFQKSREEIPLEKPLIASLSVQTWFAELLKRNGFSHLLDIISLQWDPFQKTPPHPDEYPTIRPMQPADLETVVKVDNAAFDPLWQHSLETLKRAYHQSNYVTVILHEDKIIGYLLCTGGIANCHLARIAVLPGLQGKGLGSLLLSNMLQTFTHQGIDTITVNTQSNNPSSLSLYKKWGFFPTNERFPVLVYE